MTTTSDARRRRRTREQTESELLDAALRLLERDGVLAGINLREVAKEAHVNHGQIYQYFGSRQALLRAAISRLLQANFPDRSRHWNLPFTDRRRAMWRWALRQAPMLKLQALLALDGDPELVVFPAIDRTRRSLDRDLRDGDLPEDADAEVAHAMTTATHLGYCIFRETMARDLGITPAELDRRAAAVYDRMLAGLTTGSGPSGRAG